MSQFRDTGVEDPFSAPPPPGPPPPATPEGWLAKWDENYRQFYYVNLLTKKSQWEMPTTAATGPSNSGKPYPPPIGLAAAAAVAAANGLRRRLAAVRSPTIIGGICRGRVPSRFLAELQRRASCQPERRRLHHGDIGGQEAGAADVRVLVHAAIE